MFVDISAFLFRVHSQRWDYWVMMYAFVRLNCPPETLQDTPILCGNACLYRHLLTLGVILLLVCKSQSEKDGILF